MSNMGKKETPDGNRPRARLKNGYSVKQRALQIHKGIDSATT
jgi:hypothetical protein